MSGVPGGGIQHHSQGNAGRSRHGRAQIHIILVCGREFQGKEGLPPGLPFWEAVAIKAINGSQCRTRTSSKSALVNTFSHQTEVAYNTGKWHTPSHGLPSIHRPQYPACYPFLSFQCTWSMNNARWKEYKPAEPRDRRGFPRRQPRGLSGSEMSQRGPQQQRQWHRHNGYHRAMAAMREDEPQEEGYEAEGENGGDDGGD
ncbi:hypothetical protein B0H14DRAFT_2648724 [Mycena olivaceomarginata]|nr:hypothetical protein B0H14DRAFT_2648724 [Mycena olivaceomarginata]